jgi:quercetin dioxygenase-like cupin family protein
MKTTIHPIQFETLLRSTSSWNGTPYNTYPPGQPLITLLKITIAPYTTMKWHSHPAPNAGVLLSGSLTIETHDGKKRHFVAGEAIPEAVNSIHRGITGAEAAALIVFYAGGPGLPLSRDADALPDH